MVGLPVVWHAGVKKSTEARRLVTFAQSLSSEVREFGPGGNPAYGTTQCPRRELAFAFLVLDVPEETKILLLLGRVGGSALGVLVVQQVLSPNESATDALRRLLGNLQTVAKVDELTSAFEEPMWLSRREMIIANLAEATVRCTALARCHSKDAPVALVDFTKPGLRRGNESPSPNFLKDPSAELNPSVHARKMIVDHEKFLSDMDNLLVRLHLLRSRSNAVRDRFCSEERCFLQSKSGPGSLLLD
jgi:hypothetical protein